MATPQDPILSIQLSVRASNPALLQGLDRLHELGLISDERLRNLGREQLSCTLPLAQAQTAAQPPAVDRSKREPALAAAAGGKFITQAQSSSAAAKKTAAPSQTTNPQTAKPRKPSALGNWMQSFMAEVSVLWLLFLGLFMVVVSSAVLAASQWQNFSAVGQYLVLLSYTLAFWGAGQWAGRNPKLQLTAQMVQRVALLLVPINFWAVDGFGLWRSPTGWIVAVVVAIALSFLLKQTLAPLTKALPNRQRLLINVLALSWLHWGWSIGIMPLLASYVAMVGTALNLVYPDDKASKKSSLQTKAQATQSPADPIDQKAKAEATKAKTAKQNNTLSIALVLLFGALLLLSRAVLAAGVPVAQLGLAIGLCGAVLLWRDRSETTKLPGKLWSTVGGLLMLLGWVVALQLEPPLQSFAVSLLGLLILWDRLGRLRTTFDLTAIFFVGLQAIWLARRFAPEALRQVFVDRVAAIAGNSGMPFALVGVTVFPYLLLFLWLGEGFHRSKQPKLARQALFLSTALGFGLTIFSIGNPLMRALNLTFSAITLGVMAKRREIGKVQPAHTALATSKAQLQSRSGSKTSDSTAAPTKASTKTASGGGWIALFQILTLGAVFSWAYVIGEDMSLLPWSLLCLGCVALEWFISLGIGPAKNLARSWRQSGWVTGLLVAGLGFLLSYLDLVIHNFDRNDAPLGHLCWWLVPLGLLAMAEHPRCLYPKTARVFSLITLALVQPLGWMETGTRLAGFGLATLLSGLHSRRWQRLWVVAIAVFWSIVFTMALALELWPDGMALRADPVIWGAEVGLLWLLWGLLRPQPRKLTQLYGRATKGWGIVLAIPLVLGLLEFMLDGLSRTSSSVGNSAIIAATLPSFSLMFSLWRIRSNVAALGLGLFGGLTLATILERLNASPLQAAVAFLASGWLLLLVGELWLAKHPAKISTSNAKTTLQKVTNAKPTEAQANQPKPQRTGQTTARLLELSCHLLPIAYALVGLLFGHARFTTYSGLITIVAAFILLGVSRRHRPFNILGYLGLGMVSIGCFELLFYQLSQASGGDAGDGVVLIGLLSIGLAWGLRLLLPLLHRWLKLDSNGLRQFTAAHWGLGSIIALMALLMPLSETGGLLWMGLLAIAGLYALIESRRKQAGATSNFPWLDAAIVQLLCALGYGIHLLYFWPTLLAWAAAVACPIAMLLEIMPWERWGWNSKAGQRWAALMPGIVTLLTAWDIKIQVLLIVAVFYAGLAQRRRQVRLGYISLVLVDWALLHIFDQFNLRDILWYGGLGGANLLFLAQFDPQFNNQLLEQPARNLRHWLRCLGTATVCLSGLYQAEVGIAGLSGFAAGLLPIGLGLVFIAAGIALRVRAFLYVGTVAFALRVLLQIWQYIQDDSLFLWAIGIALGLVLIWIAATFEARRSQITALMNYWVTELEAWD